MTKNLELQPSGKSAKSTFYLTTPLYYPNARPHVGSAYTTIVCDVLARYQRMCGYDVAFLTGTDEHGEKLERAAAAAEISPREFVAEKRKLFVDLWKKLGIDYTHFVYTDQPDHTTSVQRMLRLAKTNEPGVIEKRRYQGRYCVFDEMYVSEGSDPVNCPNCGRPAELISEENYFFKLSAFEDRLLAHYEAHPKFVQPAYRMNEVRSFVKSGLRDISVSRKRIKWGIPWPDDPEQVFYVWYDALTGYLTGLGYAQGEQGSAEFQKYWRNTSGGSIINDQGLERDEPAGEIVHMIGKDILRFHAVYWPAFLMAAYPNQPGKLPTTVFAHGWIYYERDKMSKSKGNVVYPEPIVDALDAFGAPGNDALRYYLLREAPFGQDTSFSYEALIQRFNSDLANDLGNLASRTITMVNKYFEGTVPSPGTPTDDERQLEAYVFAQRQPAAPSPFPNRLEPFQQGGDYYDSSRFSQVDLFQKGFGEYDYSLALGVLWGLISVVNKYLVRNQPWVLAESNDNDSCAALARVLYTAADLLRTSSILLYPFTPQSAAQLWKQLGCEGSIADQKFSDLKWQGLKPGTKVGKAEPIFPRLDKTATLAKLHELAAMDRERDKPKEALKPVESETAKAPEVSASRSPEPPFPSPEPAAASPSIEAPAPTSKITIDDFTKIELRVGQILSAEAIPGATKLLKLSVDIGAETRQVCAGIAQHYKPEELVGRKIVLVANLAPRKLRGVESNGMVLAASIGPEGKPVLATFAEDVPNGTKLK